MGDVIELKSFKHKNEKQEEIIHFLRQLDLLKQLYLSGEMDEIIIIANGKGGKCCTGNKIKIKTAKAMCNDFISNTKEYID